MSKELNQIQPLADEIEAWGDVPPLHARELYAQYDAKRAEFVAPDTCHKLHARIAELERERDAAQGALEFAQRYWMDAIAERDAANKRTKEYVGVFKRVNAAKRVWRKRAEQAEAKLVEAQSRLIAGAVYEKLDSINYWKTRAEQAEADARALAERVFDTELFGDKEAEIMFRYLPREQMNGAGYKNEETI